MNVKVLNHRVISDKSRKGQSFCSNTHEVFKYCRNLTPAKRALMVEVIKFVKLLMTMIYECFERNSFQHTEVYKELPPHYNVPGTPEQPDGDI